MKQKIAFVVKNKELVQDFGADITPVFVGNVIELHQSYGTQKFEQIVFIDEGSLAKDFKGILSFLRTKPAFQKTPIVLLYENMDFKLDFLLTDPLVRGFNIKNGIFMAVVNAANSIQQKDPFATMMTNEMIQLSYQSFLNQDIKADQEWTYAIADENEMQQAIYLQIQDELSTHILHIKFNLRILEKNLASTIEAMSALPENEIENVLRTKFSKVTKDFIESLSMSIAEAGAIHVPDVMDLQATERVQVLKHHDEQSFIFESSVATVILEMTRYI